MRNHKFYGKFRLIECKLKSKIVESIDGLCQFKRWPDNQSNNKLSMRKLYTSSTAATTKTTRIGVTITKHRIEFVRPCDMLWAQLILSLLWSPLVESFASKSCCYWHFFFSFTAFRIAFVEVAATRLIGLAVNFASLPFQSNAIKQWICSGKIIKSWLIFI